MPHWIITLVLLFQGISTVHLSPLQILHAVNHCQLRTGHTFMKDEWLRGEVGKFLTQEDLDFPTVVSNISTNIYLLVLPLMVLFSTIF